MEFCPVCKSFLCKHVRKEEDIFTKFKENLKKRQKENKRRRINAIKKRGRKDKKLFRNIKRWWALKGNYFKRVNEIAEAKFGKSKRNYKKLSDSQKKVVDSIFKKKYPHALMTKKMVLKMPGKKSFRSVCTGYPSVSKTPTNTNEKKRILEFLKTRGKLSQRMQRHHNQLTQKVERKNGKAKKKRRR